MDNNGFVGTGTTLVFGTSAIALKIKDIAWGGLGQREKVDVSALDSTQFKEFVMTQLNDPGTLTLDCWYNPDTDPTTALTTFSETMTVTFPIRTSGNATNGTWIAAGSMTEYDISGINNDDASSVSVTVEILGTPAITAESA